MQKINVNQKQHCKTNGVFFRIGDNVRGTITEPEHLAGQTRSGVITSICSTGRYVYFDDYCLQLQVSGLQHVNQRLTHDAKNQPKPVNTIEDLRWDGCSDHPDAW